MTWSRLGAAGGCVLAAILLASRLAAGDEGHVTLEYKVKAAFLFNFAKFVEWPPKAFAGDRAPVVIGLVGSSPIVEALETITRGESVRGRALTIDRAVEAPKGNACHIMFISASQESHQVQILKRCEGAPILTVGETGSFIGDGGIIRFFVDGHKVRFEISLANARRCGLRISSKLLKVARVATR